jgi:multiple antibiotic resistance protein
MIESSISLFEKLVRDALILWATIDPISTMLLFVTLTANMPDRQRRSVAGWAVVYSGIILLVSIVIGQIILSALGVTMIAFQVSGGIILLLFAVQLIFGNAMTSPSCDAPSDQSLAVFPLAIPATATPGAIMAVILLTDNHLYSIPIQAATAAIVIGILAIAYILMLAANRILKVIGRPGAEMLVRVMGLLLAALSVQLIFDALGLDRVVP